ncbi:hypothetical protein GCM10027087_02640 [Paractinoplanes abujensis]
MQRLWQMTVLQCQHHLDHTSDTGGGLQMTDVRLDRTQPQGPVLGTVLPVRGQQRTGLDRITQRGARPMGLHGIDVSGSQLRIRQRGTDHPALRRTVRRGQAIRRAVLVDRTTPDHRQHLMTVALGVGEPFQEKHAGAFTPADPVGRVRERLAAAAGRHAALLGEFHERAGRRHHGYTTREGHRALTAAQCRHGLVQRDQR